jgi:hypothetical protein
MERKVEGEKEGKKGEMECQGKGKLRRRRKEKG